MEKKSYLTPLLLVSMISSSFLCGMNKEDETQKNLANVLAQLKEKHRQKNNPQSTSKNSPAVEKKSKISPIVEEEIVVDLPVPAKRKLKQTSMDGALNDNDSEITEEELQQLAFPFNNSEPIATTEQPTPSTLVSANKVIEQSNNNQFLIQVSDVPTELYESHAPAPLPRTKGFTAWWTLQMLTKSNASVLLQMLRCKTNEFDPNNEDHLKLLDAGLNECIDSSNVDDVEFIINTCEERFLRQLELNAVTARKAHQFLTNVITIKRTNLKNKTEGTIETYKASNTHILEELKKIIAEKKALLENNFNEQDKSLKEITESQNNEIVKLKKATAAIHAINTRLKLGKDEHCSDEDDTHSQPGSKTKRHLTPDNVANKYTPGHTLQQLEMTNTLVTIENNSQKLIKDVTALQITAQNIQFSSN